MKKWLKYGVPSALMTLFIALLIANLGDQKKDLLYEISAGPSVEQPDFQRAMENILASPITSGNRITSFQNGDEIFPAMLEGIAGAKKSIDFESFIYLSGKVGTQFVAALVERAKAGVKVRLLIDWVGSGKISGDLIDQLRGAGVDVQWFHPLAWYTLTRLNNRTHRKILVIDGTVGFTGGVGISDAWAGKGDQPNVWRDSQYRIEGPVVAQLQSAFVSNWMTTHPEVLQGDDYFPKLIPVGNSRAQIFKSSPGEGSENAQIMYLLSIAAARESIFISTAYFIPGENIIRQLLAARKRGVKIQLVVPGKINDSKLIRMASRGLWGSLLEAGVEFYEFGPAMYHCKVLIVDRAWVSVGSTNFDERSLRLNSESNLNVLDPVFAAEQIRVFEADRAKSVRVTYDEWKSRSAMEKTIGWFGTLLKTQL